MEFNNATMQVGWDHNNRKETEEAKKVFVEAKKLFRRMVDEDNNPVSCFREVANKGFFRIMEVTLSPSQVAMRFVNHTGDETVVWDSTDPNEVKEVASRFNDYLEKGWKAFAIDSEGVKSRRIRRFSADMEEIVFEEGKIQKLKEFVKAFRKIELLPKTVAG